MTKPVAPRRSSSIRTVAVVIGVIATLYVAREILIPLAFSVMLTLILTPVVARMVKIGLARSFSSVLVVVISVVVAAGIGFVIFNQLIQVLNELPAYQENIRTKLEAIRAPGKGALSRATENVRELGKELATPPTAVVPPSHQNRAARPNTPAEPGRPLPVEIVAEPANVLEYLRDLAMPFLAPLGTLGIVLVSTIFLLIEQDDLRDRLFRLAGMGRINQMTRALDDATRRVSRYLLLQFIVNASFGIVCGLGLYLIGVPYAALWGAVAGLFRIVPYVGSPIAAILPLLLSLAVFDHWMPPVLVFVMFATIEVLVANFLEPWLYGTHTGISALALLLTTVFWGILWGPAGLILSTPLTVCVVVLGRHVSRFSFLHVLLGDEPMLAVEAQLYQRLLAMDDHGVRTVIDQHLSANSVTHLYDSVMIPTLTMVERDRHHATLDPDREEFIFMSIREMISDCGEKAQKTAEGAAAVVGITRPGRFLCVPANDESDEIVAAMLAQLLAAEGHVTVVFPNDEGLPRSIRIDCADRGRRLLYLRITAVRLYRGPAAGHPAAEAIPENQNHRGRLGIHRRFESRDGAFSTRPAGPVCDHAGVGSGVDGR